MPRFDLSSCHLCQKSELTSFRLGERRARLLIDDAERAERMRRGIIAKELRRDDRRTGVEAVRWSAQLEVNLHAPAAVLRDQRTANEPPVLVSVQKNEAGTLTEDRVRAKADVARNLLHPVQTALSQEVLFVAIED